MAIFRIGRYSSTCFFIGQRPARKNYQAKPPGRGRHYFAQTQADREVTFCCGGKRLKNGASISCRIHNNYHYQERHFFAINLVANNRAEEMCGESSYSLNGARVMVE
ncbi:hypothetical protein PG1C_09150 [Rugosibacter aromaticivorans]|uniref:Uncharacterized protein n=1 Tax=Rugosibacter aromaticivorans TaxID=1565605 RepID=A0A0C5J0J2_9PROT|nr:hypothetical protein [Rugosibacter aromaticivorans]AJP48567.1 hypothetical protein PG1C_09150 [Rugosibacter aromaticivorans]TBR13108.1 MAG: hypothetical protein EPO43_11655 [Rugosibacter sp.]